MVVEDMLMAVYKRMVMVSVEILYEMVVVMEEMVVAVDLVRLEDQLVEVEVAELVDTQVMEETVVSQHLLVLVALVELVAEVAEVATKASQTTNKVAVAVASAYLVKDQVEVVEFLELQPHLVVQVDQEELLESLVVLKDNVILEVQLLIMEIMVVAVVLEVMVTVLEEDNMVQ